MEIETDPRAASRLRRAHLAGVFAATLGVYALTTPRTVGFEDDGSFVMAAEMLGIAHPPGYPLFVLLAKPFTWLPWGSVAWRVHMASACFGALAACVLWIVVHRLTRAPSIALAAALLLGFGGTWWSQATVAEVYTLNALIFLALVALAQRVLADPRPAGFAALALVLGLGLSNHWPLLVLATPGLALLLWPRRVELLRALPIALPALLLGLLPYAWMAWRAHHEPVLAFHGPFESLRDFASFVARRQYATLEGADVGLRDKLGAAGFLAREWFQQYTALGAALALAGAVASLRRGASWGLGLILAFASANALLLVVFDMPYDDHWRRIARVYPLIPYAVSALWIGEGLAWLSRHAPRPGPLDPGGALGLVLVFVLLVAGWRTNDRHDFDLARETAAVYLETLPQDAVLFVSTDFETFPSGYLHHVEGRRPDVALYDEKGAVFANRLYPPDAQLAHKQRRLRDFVIASPRPVFLARSEQMPFGGEYDGFVLELDPSRAPSELVRVARPRFTALALRFVQGLDAPDPWTRYYAEFVVAEYAAFLTRLLRDRGLPESGSPEAEALQELLRTHPGRVGRLIALADRPASTAREAAALIEQVLALEAELAPTARDAYRARVHDLAGRLLEWDGRSEEAAERYRAALRADPSSTARTALRLLRIHARAGDVAAYEALRPQVASDPALRRALVELERELARKPPEG